jgi:BASS family bile acid:Na+ symporter
MTVAQLILLALKLSIIVMVFALGLKTAPSDWAWLLRRPGLLARSLLAMNVIMPAFAIAVVELMRLKHPVAVALIALSLSPVPPLLPRKQAKAGGAAPYAADLLAIAAALSVLWIPIAMAIVERIAHVPLEVAPWSVAKLIALMVLIPLLAGTLTGVYARGLADRIGPMLSRAAGIVLAIGLVLILFKFWRAALGMVGDGTLVALIGFIVAGLIVGHLLGGPDKDGRSVLALASASRHPGIAATIARLNFPDERAVPAAILLYLVLVGLVSLPYIRWRKRRSDAAL